MVMVSSIMLYPDRIVSAFSHDDRRKAKHTRVALLAIWCLISCLLSPVPGNFVSVETNSGKATIQTVSASNTSANAQINPTATPQQQAKDIEEYGHLPLSFEANIGQIDSSVNFSACGPGYTFFLTSNSVVVSLQKSVTKVKPDQIGKAHLTPPDLSLTGEQPQTQPVAPAVLQIKLVGANPVSAAVGQDELPGKSNYFIGNDPAKWRTNIANYSRVLYREVYPGVGMSYYGNNGQLEYDFNLEAGTDPSQIKLDFSGADKLQVQGDGSLMVALGESQLTMPAPFIFQLRGGQRQPVRGGYVLQNNHTVTFQLNSYDTSLPLTIDPVLSYSTYLSTPTSNLGSSIAVDSTGNAYITGHTDTLVPNTVGAIQPALAQSRHVYVNKLNSSGTALLYSTYFGGDGIDGGSSIALDNSGNAYVTGSTSSTNFPTTPGAFQTKNGGSGVDAFVIKLNASGSALLYSTYLGGSGYDRGNGIALDSSGNAYITGSTNSTDFPITVSAFQIKSGGGSYYDAFVTKLNGSGSALLYSTYLGGTGNDYGQSIAVDNSGNAFITGYITSTNFPATTSAFQTSLGGTQDGFVSKLNASGNALLYSTYLGGTGDEYNSAVAVDSSGNAYITGFTNSSSFPTTAGAFQTSLGGTDDTFVSKLNASGSALIYSTYLGGIYYDHGYGIAVDSSGNAYVTGITMSTDFPFTPDAFQTKYSGIGVDAFVSKLNASGSALIYSTYLGGSTDVWGYGVTVDSSGNAYITGSSDSFDFPTTAGAFQTKYGGGINAIVARFSLSAAGIPATIMVAGGSSQNAPINNAFPTPFAVLVKDNSGTGVPNVIVTFTASTTPTTTATGTFSNRTNTAMALTNASGVATAPTFTSNGYVGDYVVTASVTGAASPALFHLYNSQLIVSPAVVANTALSLSPVITNSLTVSALPGSPVTSWTANLIYDQAGSPTEAAAPGGLPTGKVKSTNKTTDLANGRPRVLMDPWLVLDTYAGTVSPSQSVIVSAIVNTAGLDCGTHTATVLFSNNANPNNDVAVVNLSVSVASCSYYLPFVANAWHNFTTYTAVQNTGPGIATITTQFFGSSGSRTVPADFGCAAISVGGECILSNPFNAGDHGTGIINSNRPLSIIVAEGTPYGGSAYAVNAISTSSLLNVPLAINNAVGFQTQIIIANLDSQATSGTVAFYDTNGTHLTAADKPFSLAANSSLTFDQTATDSGLPPGFYGWAQIQAVTSDSKLAAQVLEQNPDNHFVAIANAQLQAATRLYAPAIFNGAYGGFVTGANIVNPTTIPVSVTITYYDQKGQTYPSAPFTIPAYGVQAVFHGSPNGGVGLPAGGLPASFAGTASILVTVANSNEAERGTSHGVLMTVNEGGGLTGKGNARSGVYNSTDTGSSRVSLPVIANNGLGGFTSGTTILNISDKAVNGLIIYYKMDGTPTGISQQFPNLAPHASYAAYQGAAGLRSSFYGVAVVSEITGGSGNDLVVTTNVQSDSYFYAYNEPN